MKHRNIKLLALTLLFAVGQALHAQNFSGIAEEIKNQNTPAGWDSVALPQLPAITSANTLDITSYGASTSSADNTTAIQAALNAVPATGGMVVVPAGEWLCGPIRMKSRTILHLAAGATLKLLPYGSYPSDGSNFIDGKSTNTDLVVEGEDKTTSIIDGQGEAWWKAYESDKTIKRGACIRFSKGARFLIRNLTVKNTPGVNITISQSGKGSHGTVHDVIIREPSSTTSTGQKSHNTDGISVWGPHVNIYNCDISNGDDNVVLDANAQYVHVWNCTFGYGHGASVGSYTGNVKHVIFDGISFTNTGSGVRLKSNNDRGGGEEDFLFQNLTMKNVPSPFSMDCYYDKKYTTPANDKANAQDSTSSTPNFRNIYLKNIVATGGTGYAIFLYGRPESHIKNVTLDNVQISAAKGISSQFVDNLRFINGSKITPASGAMWLSKYDVTVSDECNATGETSGGTKGTGEKGVLEISKNTLLTSEAGRATFSGGVTLSNEKGKTYDQVGDFDGLKHSAMQSTFSFPDSIQIDTIEFYGRDNYNDATSYISEIAGHSYESSVYVFPVDKTVFKTFKVALATPVEKTLTFTIKGRQAVLQYKLYYEKLTTGITAVRAAHPARVSGVYDLMGRRVSCSSADLSSLSPGIYIVDGRKVVVR